jgi:hypothetical protein
MLMQNFILEHLEQYFESVEPLQFYRSIFPTGELEIKNKREQGKYHAIAVELLPKAAEDRKNIKKYIVYDDLEPLEALLQSDNFVIISPISYIGRSRKSENARFMYALAIDLDGIPDKAHLHDLFHQMKIEYIPRPTYIVFSGNGIHLYYQFSRPIPCFKNIIQQLSVFKHELTRKIWNGYVTSLYENVQYESLFQGFRLAGGVAKDGSRTKIFKTGDKVDIEYLNKFVSDEYKVTQYTYKSDLTLEKAKELYPEWYDKRVVKGISKGTWTCKRDVFDWWLRRLKGEITVGHRYYGVMILAIYAKKCGIDRTELETVAFDLIDTLETLTDKEDNHFTRQDVLAALEMYNDSYITFPIDSIVNLTGIQITKNRRNYRTRQEHIKLMNFIRDEIKHNTDWRNKNGRPTKEKEVIEWRRLNPNGSKADCIRATGLDRKTVSKYWGAVEL